MTRQPELNLSVADRSLAPSNMHTEPAVPASLVPDLAAAANTGWVCAKDLVAWRSPCTERLRSQPICGHSDHPARETTLACKLEQARDCVVLVLLRAS